MMKFRRWLGLCWAGLMALLLTACGQGSTPYDSIVINFVNTATPSEIAALAKEYNLTLRPSSNSAFARQEVIYLATGEATHPRATRRLLQRLQREALVEYAHPNYQFQAAFVPNDPLYSQQWNLRAIRMPEAWEISQGEGVTVAVVDTGVTRVPDLAQTEFVKGYDFVDDDEDPTDLNGHGTHVAGTLAQSTNNALGVAGVAFKAKIMPVRVLDANGFGSLSDVVEGIRYAVDHGATVINLSLGSRASARLMEEAVAYAHSKGVTVVAAAGNENSSQVSYPARYPHVIAVSATGPDGTKAPYSNYGVGVDIAAPGGAKTPEHPEYGILQQTINRRNPDEPVFAYFQGTSMAAPHVAGVAALIQAQGIKDPDKVEAILKMSAAPVPGDKQNFYGAGLLDAARALARARGQQEENPLVLWLKDFLKYLNDNGYLNPRFWFDGGAIALVPKLLMVVGGYILLVLIRWWLAPKPVPVTVPLLSGILLGSAGLFPLQGLAIVGFPRWPLQLLGSSLPELGTALAQTNALDPLFASVLIPGLLMVLLLGHRRWRWAVIGLCLGVASHLLLSGSLFYEGVLWLGSSAWLGRSFLLLNGLLCLGLAYLGAQAILDLQPSSTVLALRK
ncbi:S8 family serine peptidase [Synechococcus sp. O70.1]|jgi:serine protease|uniref:S8 family serine peptidase n=1 Tax=unclassified Synechococcus TaxID=2626047 RepID=UPI0039C1423C